MKLKYTDFALRQPTYGGSRDCGQAKTKAKTENLLKCALVGPMSVISSHAVLHTGVILTKRSHIVLTAMRDPFQQHRSRTWSRAGIALTA